MRPELSPITALLDVGLVTPTQARYLRDAAQAFEVAAETSHLYAERAIVAAFDIETGIAVAPALPGVSDGIANAVSVVLAVGIIVTAIVFLAATVIALIRVIL